MKNEIKVMIVDDEQEAVDLLVILLEESFPNINIVATANSSTEAILKAFKKHPDLVFLDIKIDSKNGFDIVEDLQKENHVPHFIFVTAFNEYAIDAFKTNAIDYLLKPVDSADLVHAVNKFQAMLERENYLENVLSLIGKSKSKIQFNGKGGFILIEPDDILYCKSDGNYSQIFLKDNTKRLVSYNLRNLHSLLPNNNFKRISRYYIVNYNYLSEVNRKNKTCILSYNGFKIELGYSVNLSQF